MPSGCLLQVELRPCPSPWEPAECDQSQQPRPRRPISPLAKTSEPVSEPTNEPTPRNSTHPLQSSINPRPINSCLLRNLEASPLVAKQTPSDSTVHISPEQAKTFRIITFIGCHQASVRHSSYQANPTPEHHTPTSLSPSLHRLQAGEPPLQVASEIFSEKTPRDASRHDNVRCQPVPPRSRRYRSLDTETLTSKNDSRWEPNSNLLTTRIQNRLFFSFGRNATLQFVSNSNAPGLYGTGAQVPTDCRPSQPRKNSQDPTRDETGTRSFHPSPRIPSADR